MHLLSKAIVLLFSAMLCSGMTYWKKNTPQLDMIEDQIDCTVEGLKSAPADRDSYGYDRNFELRSHVVGKCMKSKGYQEVKVKTCGPFKKSPDLSLSIEITKKTCSKGIEKAYIFVN